MHERADHQASGLASLSRTHGARLAALVRHGDEASELPLLWRLCLTWVELGYPVTVLDAGTCETADNPGLDQLLDFPGTALAHHHDSAVWNVVPSAIGLQTLLDSPKKHLPLEQRLGGLFADDGVVVVYGSANTLTQLFADRTLQPLLVVSSERTSLLTSYQALKRLLREPGLTPLVIEQSVTCLPHTVQPRGAAETLADCAGNFLSIQLPLVQLPPHEDTVDSRIELQRLALRVLENAVPLYGRWMLPTLAGAKMDTRLFTRSH